MNPRIVAIVIGILTVLMGIVGLVSPDMVMTRVVGFAVHPAFSEYFVRGEVRAAYGGLFFVLGLVTLSAVLDPAAARQRLLIAGSLWLGLCGGRLIGALSDGSPGGWGWFAAAFELAFGGLLVAAALMARPVSTQKSMVG